jgi:anaerobic selenocysteine-containing dehydrogenase
VSAGHSNVQGDRTVGITERPAAAFLARLGAEFGFTPPSAPGLNTVGAIGALRDGGVRVFLALGGNFAVATPDARATAEALGRCRLAVQIATTLNRTPLVAGREALLLPCLVRSERDVQAGGEQFVTVEDSMSVVHASRGRLTPARRRCAASPRSWRAPPLRRWAARGALARVGGGLRLHPRAHERVILVRITPAARAGRVRVAERACGV